MELLTRIKETKIGVLRKHPAHIVPNEQTEQPEIQHHHVHPRGAHQPVQVLLQLLLPLHRPLVVRSLPESWILVHIHSAFGIRAARDNG